MPTKKRRVGFIPRSDVLEIIIQLSIESNLSTSKIINILVEEAMYKRGILNKKNQNTNIFKNNLNKDNSENSINDIKENIQDFKNNLLNNSELDYKKNHEPIDSEIYKKFLMFLKFQEMIKKSDL